MSSLVKRAPGTLPIFVVTAASYKVWLKTQPAPVRNWLADFKPEPGTYSLFPDTRGKRGKVVAVTQDPAEIWDLAALPYVLPPGTYRLTGKLTSSEASSLALGWELGAYKFTRYKKLDRQPAKLVMPEAADSAFVTAQATAICRGRDLINTPAEDMTPAEIAAAVQDVGKTHGAKIKVIVGDALLKENFPLLHAVGRASPNAPRLVDLHWGNPNHPKSPWSARASASILAVWTSNPPAPCIL